VKPNEPTQLYTSHTGGRSPNCCCRSISEVRRAPSTQPWWSEYASPTIYTGTSLRGILNSGTLTVDQSTFFENGPAGFGGGIFSDGTATVTNSTFTLNTSDADGGGIDNRGNLTVVNSTFFENGPVSIAAFLGGGIFNDGTATATVTNSTFSGNIAQFGGGIDNRGNLTVTDCTFRGNVAFLLTGGGGMENDAPATVTNSTFFGNSQHEIVGFSSLHGTIVAGKDSGGNCGSILGGPEITDLGYNISDDDSCGFSATSSLNSTDPKLGALINNGGPTFTVALLSGSPAIDAIPLDSCLDQMGNQLTTDQRGFPRPDAVEGVCDIGAYEFQDFVGQPGKANCYGKTMSALSNHYRSIEAAASALGFPNVRVLQDAIRKFCKK
jgi:Right handed beta helix region